MIPRTEEEITTEWLSLALQNLLNEHNRITGFKIQDGSSGRGFTGQILKILLQYEKSDGELPESVIYKTQLRLDLPLEATKRMFKANLNEVRWYTEWSVGCPVAMPRCHYAEVDENDHSTCMLLEDLSSMLAAPPEKGLDRHQAELALKNIARIHGQYWELENDFVEVRENLKSDFFLRNIDQGWNELVTHFPHLFDENFAEKKETFITCAQTYPAVLLDRRTLIHGDFKLDNVLFHPNDPDKMVLLDWQGISQGSAAFEVAGFLPRSLTVDDYSKWNRELLRTYHDELCEQDRFDYSFTEFLQDYEIGLIVSFIGNIGFTQTLLNAELSGGDPARENRMRAYFELIFRRKYKALKLD